MVRRLLFGVGVLTCFVAATPILDACGDKFLLIGRALKYRQTYAAAHAASILAYTQSPRVADLIGKQGLGALLKLVGHRVRIVDSSPPAAGAESGSDVVIVPAGGATDMRQRAGTLQIMLVLFSADDGD